MPEKFTGHLSLERVNGLGLLNSSGDEGERGSPFHYEKATGWSNDRTATGLEPESE